MNASCRKVWDQYEEGRITPTGFIIDFLNAAGADDLREALDVIPPALLDELRAFVLRYRPELRVFGGPPPTPAAIAMAREVLAATVTSR